MKLDKEEAQRIISEYENYLWKNIEKMWKNYGEMDMENVILLYKIGEELSEVERVVKDALFAMNGISFE